jgi:Uma2 family endonuclease
MGDRCKVNVAEPKDDCCKSDAGNEPPPTTLTGSVEALQMRNNPATRELSPTDMAAKLKPADQMTIEEFLAFADAQPDGEKWELIEGMAYMSPSPVDWHQMVVGNIVHVLLSFKAETGATWRAMPGVGTRVPVSPKSLPRPDVFIKEGALTGGPTTDDALVLFEVLSKSNSRGDQAWRKRVYASIPNCQHYVTVATKRAEIVRYDRADGWKGVTVAKLTSELEIPAIDVSIPLAHIYRWTPIK